MIFKNNLVVGGCSFFQFIRIQFLDILKIRPTLLIIVIFLFISIAEYRHMSSHKLAFLYIMGLQHQGHGFYSQAMHELIVCYLNAV